MGTNIQKTKRDLTIIFTVIFFLVILSFGSLFFGIKYTKEIRAEKINFSAFINLIENGKLSINDVTSISKIFDSKLQNKGGGFKNDMQGGMMKPEFQARGFINYLLLDKDNTIISGNIKDDISEELIENILNKKSYLRLKQEYGFFIRKFNTDKNGTFIVLKRLRYGFPDFISDILGFLFISFLFSALIYYIGKRFVNKAFIPVEENIKDMSNFIHNAGHELKTPISVIDSNIQLIDDMKIYDKEMTKELKDEVIRLNSLIDSLVRLSGIDVLKNTEDIILKEAIEKTVNDFKKKISDKKIKVNIDIKKSIIISSNKDYFYIFLSNLIGNAIKYNNEKGIINISYKASELIIKDSGIGIKKEDLGKIYDRFYKIDKSRNSEGFGIGLSLVKKISDIYKWKIKVESEEGEGTKFFIRFN